MTPSERRFWRAVQGESARWTAEQRRQLLQAWRLIEQRLAPGVVEAYLARGDVVGLLGTVLNDATMGQAFAGLRRDLQQAVASGMTFHGKQLPQAVGTLGIAFDVLNPRVIDAIRTLDQKHVASAVTAVREVVRAVAENGLRDGVSPRTVARQIRGVVGLGPTQLAEVANFRRALETGDVARALRYARRDRRFDGSVRRGTLTAAQIDRMVATYARRRIAWNAETAARTAALDANRAAQRLAWEDAIAVGAADRGELRRRWVTVLDGRERPEHHALNGTVVGFDERFPNGELTPGESTYNCRCLAVVFVARSESSGTVRVPGRVGA